MSDWQTELEAALADFRTISGLCGVSLHDDDLAVSYCPSPHQPPQSLPPGKMAVYGFWGAGGWLKIGKAGPRSKARYTSQHYNAGSAKSTLAGSLLKDFYMAEVPGFDPAVPGNWIKSSTHRFNVLLPSSKPKELLSLLEAFLHLRLRPRYEG